MRNLRIYLDTSVISFVFADDAPHYQQATLAFFSNARSVHELFVSDVVLGELRRTPDPEQRACLLSVISRYEIEILPNDELDQIRSLALVYVGKGIIPQQKVEDALHVAYATVNGMDVLLSWNFQHLANVSKEARLLAANLEEGYRYPLRLVSPLEVLNE